MAKRKCHHCEQKHNEADFTVCKSCFQDKETEAEKNCRTCTQNKNIPIVIIVSLYFNLPTWIIIFAAEASHISTLQ